ncbi:MAG: tetratricopeptide repeat protein [Microcoleus anatoxicus]|uniref:tetratricopeptide repeat protein n=1 Tax=Microcoleus anatoxicus TaxID=2705319 RepID=UPI00366DC63B
MLSENKEKTVRYFQVANQLKHEGKLEEAIAPYLKAIEQNPNFHWSHHNLAEVFARLERWDDALAHYSRAIEIDPNSACSHHKMGEVLAKNGQLDVAIIQYHRAIDLSTNIDISLNSYVFYNSLGKALHQLSLQINLETIGCYHRLEEILSKGNDRNCSNLYYLNDEEFLQATTQLDNEAFLEEVYRTYLKRDADEFGKKHWLQHFSDGITRNQILGTFRQAPEFTSQLIFSVVSFCLKEAISAYSRAIELNPNVYNYENLEEALVQQGSVLTQQGKIDGAIESYRQAIAISHNLAEAHHRLGNALVEKGKIDEALESYQQAIATKPNWVQAHLSLGNALFQQYKLELAIESYKQAITLDSHSAEAHFRLGNSLLEQSQFDEARESYEQALNLEPNWAELHFRLGNTFLLQGNYRDALACHRKALTLNPNWEKDSYFSLGYCLLDNPQHLEGVLQIYEQALSLRSDWIEGYYTAGNWLHLAGYLEEALNFWNRCTKVRQNLADAHQMGQNNIHFFGYDFTRAIGHTAFLDSRIKMHILGWLPVENQYKIFAPPHHYIANWCMLNYWSFYCPIVSDPSQSSLVSYSEERNAMVTLANGKNIFYATAAATAQKQWETENRPPLLALSASDQEKGREYLRKLGVPNDAWFVCLHVREAGLYERCNPIKSIRNADIMTYSLAIESIIAQGGWVIRMGDSTMTPLPAIRQVIDYVHSDLKSDWMDVVLWSQCRFLLGTTSGPYLVPPTFGVPCVLTNWAPLSTPPYFGNDIFIPKLYWSESENRYLTFPEQISPPIGYHLEYLKPSMSIRVIDNTPEEINDLVLEMLERLDGKIKYTEEDKNLQEKFNLVSESYGIYGAGSRMGQKFLRKYTHLLDTKNKSLDLKEFS